MPHRLKGQPPPSPATTSTPSIKPETPDPQMGGRGHPHLFLLTYEFLEMTGLSPTENPAHNKCPGWWESLEVNSPGVPLLTPQSLRRVVWGQRTGEIKRDVGSSSFQNADKMFQILTTLWWEQEGLKEMRTNFLMLRKRVGVKI